MYWKGKGMGEGTLPCPSWKALSYNPGMGFSMHPSPQGIKGGWGLGVGQERGRQHHTVPPGPLRKQPPSPLGLGKTQGDYPSHPIPSTRWLRPAPTLPHPAPPPSRNLGIPAVPSDGPEDGLGDSGERKEQGEHPKRMW